ncbi:MAG TPA: single-stranded DNA-binding protein [Thermoleophilaceae bacterium]
MNSISITGRLTRDPELRATPNGTSVTTLRIASPRARKRDEVDYFGVTAWSGLAESCAEHLEKGRLVHIVGRIEYREWNDPESGSKRHDYDVVAENVEFLGPKPSTGEGDQSPEPQQATA